MNAFDKAVALGVITVCASIIISFTSSCDNNPPLGTILPTKKMMRIEVEQTSDPNFFKVTVDSGHQYLAQRYTFVDGGAGGMTHLAGCEYCKNNLSSKKIDQ